MADDAIDDWLARFDAALMAGDAAAAALFEPDGYWRDLLTFTWNIRTMEGREAIADMLDACLARTAPFGLAADGPARGDRGRHGRLDPVRDRRRPRPGRVTIRDGRCHVLLTAMEDIKGHEEPRGRAGRGHVHRADRNRAHLVERRAETARLGREDQPEVLIIGGGTGRHGTGRAAEAAGRADADRREERAARRQLAQPLPQPRAARSGLVRSPALSSLPRDLAGLLPKDKMGDWLEAYALVFELDSGPSTTCDQRALGRGGRAGP
jgi:putative flavoprotein involved in K+ transport